MKRVTTIFRALATVVLGSQFVSDPIEAQITIGKLAEELVHMNGDHEFTYDRETLIKILDAEEAVRKGERPRRMPGEH